MDLVAGDFNGASWRRRKGTEQPYPARPRAPTLSTPRAAAAYPSASAAWLTRQRSSGAAEARRRSRDEQRRRTSTFKFF